MPFRKSLIAAVAIVAILIAFVGRAEAAQPTVEIISISHRPVQQSLASVRTMLEKYKGRIRVVELDAEASEGVKALKAVGLKGHIPILILIDGKYSFNRPDGTTVKFQNFPAAAKNPMGLNGTWTVTDVEAVLVERLK
jgi:hypothetical protein